MKLNIGCGDNYLKGYINIDSNRNSRADRIMQAHDLDFKSGSVVEIIARHIIEHLGFFKAKYFLSECFRVLKPGGILKIETPHIEKTFKIFLKAKSTRVREKALGWVYGAETEGMEHRYCFPVELMEMLTTGSGFKILKKEFFDYDTYRPAYRFILQKPVHSPKFSFIAEFRKELLKRKIPCFANELVSFEQEKIIDKVIELEGGVEIMHKKIAKLGRKTGLKDRELKKIYKSGLSGLLAVAVASLTGCMQNNETRQSKLPGVQPQNLAPSDATRATATEPASTSEQTKPADKEQSTSTPQVIPEPQESEHYGPYPGYPSGTKYYTVSILDFEISL